MRRQSLLAVVFGCIACGGASAPANAPPPPPPSAEPAPAAEQAEPAPAAPASSAAADPATPAPSSASESSPAPTAAPKVDFPSHATVEQATNAVPRGGQRMNMSNDTLQGPLLDMKRYDQCKVPRSAKITMNVAVYDGAAVGVDVITKPRNAKLEACLDGVVRSMSWDKVPSLNEVNVSF
jgi:hypothetical protein